MNKDEKVETCYMAVEALDSYLSTKTEFDSTTTAIIGAAIANWIASYGSEKIEIFLEGFHNFLKHLKLNKNDKPDSLKLLEWSDERKN